MSEEIWRSVPGFDKYILSNEGCLKRIAYDEPSGRHIKELIVSITSVGRHYSVRLLTDDKDETFISFPKLIHQVFPEIPKEECKQIAEQYFKKCKSGIRASVVNLPGEVWKDCAGHEEAIQVSTMGRIKRKSRVITRSNGRQYTITEVLLKQTGIGRNYRCINLSTRDPDSSGKFEFVHRLIALTFIPNPDNLPEVNHKDGDGSNNRVDNLEWSSHIENAAHAWDTGLYRTKHPIRCLETGEEFDSIYAFAKLKNMHWPTVSNKIASNSPIDGLHYQYIEKL